jgi:hypothetical protein
VRAKAPAPAPRIEEPPKEETPAATEAAPASPPENPETQS